MQGCDRRRYYVIYVNVLKIDVIYVIFDFEDVIRYFCQNETLFLSNWTLFLYFFVKRDDFAGEANEKIIAL